MAPSQRSIGSVTGTSWLASQLATLSSFPLVLLLSLSFFYALMLMVSLLLPRADSSENTLELASEQYFSDMLVDLAYSPKLDKAALIGDDSVVIVDMTALGRDVFVPPLTHIDLSFSFSLSMFSHSLKASSCRNASNWTVKTNTLTELLGHPTDKSSLSALTKATCMHS